MKIVELKSENFKRLQAVHIEPDGNVVQITGRNAQGKSSVLDVIHSTLGGKDCCPSKPIRKGQKSAKNTLKLSGGEELTVVRTFQPGRRDADRHGR